MLTIATLSVESVNKIRFYQWDRIIEKGEWKVFFRKVVEEGGIYIEPDSITIFVDAVTGETAKFPMI